MASVRGVTLNGTSYRRQEAVFGHGPLIPGYGRPARPDTLYHCVDVNPRYAHNARNETLTNVRFVVGTPREAGLADHSMDAVHVHNVFNDPGALAKGDLFQTALRVLKPGRPLYVAHTLTHDVFPRELIDNTAAAYGLRVVTLVDAQRNRPKGKLTPADLRRLKRHVGYPYENPNFSDAHAYLVKLVKPRVKST